jgi:hypothetical protein
MSQTVTSNEFGFLRKLTRLVTLFDKSSRLANKTRPIAARPITVAEILIDKATGQDLMQISPLGALQIEIEEINLASREPASFKENLAEKLFGKEGKVPKKEVAILWERSEERKIITEIYSQISLSAEVGRPITFRDSFIRVYEIKQDAERAILNKIAKALIFG